MPKKAGEKKKTATKKKTPKKITSEKQDSQMEKVLIQNFISLQKVMTNVAIKFDALNMQISKLLELFEISAKTLAEKDIELNKERPGIKGEEKMAEKLDALLDQNKIIARGLTLLHEPQQQMPMPRPMPTPARTPMPQPTQQMQQRAIQPLPTRPLPKMNAGAGGYQKSSPLKKNSPKRRKSKKNDN